MSPKTNSAFHARCLRRVVLATAIVSVAGSHLSAQPPVSQTAASADIATQLARGDAELFAKRPSSALAIYEAILRAAPAQPAALWRAASTALVLGQFAEDSEQRRLYALARDYGKRAVDADSTSASAHFAYAYAMGREGMRLETTGGNPIPFSDPAYEHATACLRINPASAECMVVLGVWHLVVGKYGPQQREYAKIALHSKYVGEANQEKGEALLAQAIAAQPRRIAFRYERALIHWIQNDSKRAMQDYEEISKLAPVEYNDDRCIAMAKDMLSTR